MALYHYGFSFSTKHYPLKRQNNNNKKKEASTPDLHSKYWTW